MIIFEMDGVLWEGFQPIVPMVKTLQMAMKLEMKVEIWTEIPESMRTHCENWLDDQVDFWQFVDLEEYMNYKHILNMRPDDDNRTGWQVKKDWLDQARVESQGIGWYCSTSPVQIVFESSPSAIEMYREHGIFTLDCRQK